ncbi:methyl-accepting chemotaxis protein [Rubrivivax gelatinosus]|uniref:methyl-accepting chemotaxis protein n=1 Tax=Rubrivivax gelatinosus TaxID=28068 RepID=UPI0005C1AB6C|nr:methyl-accepting chemotaxis protein [Rubrivivax gelatinosus]
MLKTLSGAKSIGRRLSTVLALVLLISFVGSGFGYWALSRTAAANQDMLEDSLVSERLASDWYRNISGGVNRTTAIAVSSDANLGKFFADVSAESTKQSTELQKKLEPMMKTEAEKALYEKLAATRKIYLGSRDEVYAARQAGEAEKAHDISQNKFQPAAAQFQEAIRALVQMQRDELDAEAAKAADANRAARIALVVFGTCALVVGAALALWLTRSITVPLNEAVEVADTIASFDLSRPITPRGEDETGRLLRSLQSMQSSLRRLIGEVRASTDSIGTASSEIASGNMDLSARTEQTASNLQQAAASMTQLASTVRQTADAAGTASGLANTAASVAQRGGEVVSQVVSTMDEISTSSHRINDIIGVIDVRSLAQRSAQAAREIKGLIGSAVDSVETGSRMVQEAGSTMTELVASVQRVNQLIGEIGNATREQSDGISQLNAGVSQLDQMTQQNAALVEEAASAAGSLKDQSTRLASAVSVFRL